MTEIPGMTVDTDPTNPVNEYPADTFPIGAALTVAYGSNERPFCTLGNLYRLLAYLTGQVPGGGDVNAAIDACRHHVATHLPTELRVVDPPPADTGPGGDTTPDLAWVAGIANKYGPTITIRPIPNEDNTNDTLPADN